MIGPRTTRRYAVAVDIGGTFTDVTLVDRVSGRLWQAKTPTTPHDQSQAFASGICRVLKEAGVSAAHVEGVFHGTTIATNAILERKGATVGLITTKGCRYVLHIGRHDVAKGANSYFWIRPQRLVPPRRVHELVERTGPDGSVEREFDEESCREALRALKRQGIDSLAVCLLHAYANPAHERRVRELAATELPGVPCSLSCEVLPVFREYERTTATVMNAYVTPQVAGYHRRLEAQLRELGIAAPLRIMKSNGGMYSARAATSQPIHTALSGPAAAAVGAILVAQAAARTRVISIDVGGTSADICLSQESRPSVTSGGEISGLPLNVPMLDVHTIGAGGGSIARVTANGSLLVGPESAGAEPGPACYGRGGIEPTVTDANLVLGRIPALLGGEVRLDVALAERAILDRVAKPLGLALHEAAEGIVELLNNNMAAAIRAVSVERGYDPRVFSLVAGGGGGALHAGRLAELLHIPLVIVPASAGLLSTLGLLATDLKSDFEQTTIQRGSYDLDKLNATLNELERRAAEWLASEGVAPGDAALARTAGLRYVNQAYEIRVALPQISHNDDKRAAPLTDSDLAQLQAHFHDGHEQLYSWSSRDLPVELVNIGVTAYGRLPKLVLAEYLPARAACAASSRPVYFGRSTGLIDTPVHDFAALAPGETIEGPAVIEQRFSTALILPRHSARIDHYGNILMEVRQ